MCQITSRITRLDQYHSILTQLVACIRRQGVFLIFYMSLSLNRVCSNTLQISFPYIIKSETKILTRFILAQSIKLSDH